MDFCIQDNEIYYVDKSGEKAAEVTFPSIDADTVEIIIPLCPRPFEEQVLQEN